MTEAQARKSLVEAGRRLLAEGLVARSWGNLSVRLDNGSMAVTPSGIPYPELTEEMIVVVDLETGAWSGDWKPSGERKVHREIYRSRSEVHAVVHTHQSAASACAAARLPVPTRAGLVRCAPYALPGTKALTRGTVAALGQGPAVLMANHGVFTVGSDLEQAFRRIADLERDCADHLAARIGEAAAIEARLLLGLEHPVRTRIADREEIAHRNVEPDPVVVAARLEHQHARFWICRQPVGHHAASRACAHDDVVVFAFHGAHRPGGHSAKRFMSPV